MLRLLTTARWLRLAAVTVLAALACVALGMWQLDRLAERRARNALIETNLTPPAVPVDSLLPTGRRPTASQEWRHVEVSGVYDASRTVLIRNRQLQGNGYHVLVPLIRDDAPAVLVVRGWIPATRPATVPPAPEGRVSVTGRLRAGEALASPGALRLDESGTPSVARLDPALLGARLPYPAHAAYVEAVQENPDRRDILRLPEPSTGEGAHLAYGVQWLIFAVLAVGGYVVLLRREAGDRLQGPAVEQTTDGERVR